MKGAATAAPKSTTGSLVTPIDNGATSGKSTKPAVAVCDHHERAGQRHELRGSTAS